MPVHPLPPTNSHVCESIVIDAPLGRVWQLLKPREFSRFWTALKKSVEVTTEDDAEIVHWVFKDGSSVDVKIEERSYIDHYVTYSVIAAEPALSYSSAISRVKLYPITTGAQAGQTYAIWTCHFSSDADANVIEDAKYKRRDALADLAKAARQK